MPPLTQQRHNRACMLLIAMYRAIYTNTDVYDLKETRSMHTIEDPSVLRWYPAEEALPVVHSNGNHALNGRGVQSVAVLVFDGDTHTIGLFDFGRMTWFARDPQIIDGTMQQVPIIGVTCWMHLPLAMPKL